MQEPEMYNYILTASKFVLEYSLFNINHSQQYTYETV